MPPPVLSSNGTPQVVCTNLGVGSGAETPDLAVQAELWPLGAGLVKDPAGRPSPRCGEGLPVAVHRKRRQSSVSSEENRPSSVLDPTLADLVDHLGEDLARDYVLRPDAPDRRSTGASDLGSEETRHV